MRAHTGHRGMVGAFCLLAAAGAGCSESKSKDDKGAAPPDPIHRKADVLPTGRMAPIDLASDGEYLYWTNSTSKSGTVVRSALSGQSMALLAKDETDPAMIAVDSGFVYWSETGGILRAPKAGGSKEIVLRIDDHLGGIAGRDGKLYFTSYDKGTVNVVEAGKDAVVIASGQDHPLKIAVDETSVYWTTTTTGGPGTPRSKNGTVMKAPLAGGPAVVLAKDQFGPDVLAQDATHVYWAMPASGDHAIRSVAKAGGAPVTLADAGGARGLGVADGFVYLATPRAIKRVPVAGGPIAEIAQTDEQSGGFIAAGDSLFLSHYSRGQLLRLTRTK